MSMNTDKSSSDNELSKHYRAIADERAPDRLNEKVLRRATDAVAKTQDRGLLGLWSKPLAWAATIGLSLAVVLELSQSPLLPAAAERPASAILESEQDSAPEVKRESSRVGVIADAVSGDAATDAAIHDIAVESRQAPQSVSQDFAPNALETIEEAENLVRMQNGPNLSEPDLREIVSKSAPTAPTRSDSARSNPARPNDEPPSDGRTSDGQSGDVRRERSAFAAGLSLSVSGCDDASQATRALWTACIKELRSIGETAIADQEYARLLVTFPEHPED